MNRAEEDLRLTQISVNVAAEGIFWITPKGKIFYANNAICKALQYSSDELKEMYVWDFDPLYSKDKWNEHWQEIKNKGLFTIETVHRSKDGSEYPVEISVNYIQSDNNEFNFAYIKDITNRKKADKKIKTLLEETQDFAKKLEDMNEKLQATNKELQFANEELKKREYELCQVRANLELKVKERTEELEFNRHVLSDILNSIQEDFYMLDRDWNCVYISKSAAAAFNAEPEDLIGANIWEYRPRYIGTPFEENFRWVMEHREVRKFEVHGKYFDRWYSVTVYPSNEGITVWAADITDRINAEEKLKEIIKELERSNKELQSFAYITSHDLQEPLRTIASYAQLLERRYKGRLDSDADDFLEFMVAGATRMKDQIKDLLEYSRVGTCGEFKEFDSEKAFDNALNSLKSLIEEYNGEITHDKLPVLMGNESQIIRVLQNLIENALKFHREGVKPKIHISADKTNNGKVYVFSVQDNGIGIEEQYKDYVFEVFKRIHPIGEYQGSGMGLTIIKRIIEHHGGRVWVESDFGVGSTFYFTIPI